MWATLSVTTGQTPGARGWLCCIWSWGWTSLRGGIAFESGWESVCCWISVNCINCSSLSLALLYLETSLCVVFKAHRPKTWHVKHESSCWIWEGGGIGQEGLTSWAPFSAVRKSRVASDAFQCCVSQAFLLLIKRVTYIWSKTKGGRKKPDNPHVIVYRRAILYWHGEELDS